MICTPKRQTQERPNARWHRGRWARSGGYTAVEVLMSMAVLGAGISGVVAMQKVTVSSNRHAKNLSLATHVGQSWLGLLGAESALWNQGGVLTRAPHLEEGLADNGEWSRPSFRTATGFGAAFDALGNPLPLAAQDQARFCVDLRVSSLQNTAGGAGIARIEVRVVWPREGRVETSVAPPTHACAFAADQIDSADYRAHLHRVFLVNSARQVAR